MMQSMKKQLLQKNGWHDILKAKKRVRSMQKNAGREEVGKTGVEDITKISILYATDRKNGIAERRERVGA